MPPDPKPDTSLAVVVTELHEAAAKVNILSRLAAIRGATVTMDSVERARPEYPVGYPELVVNVTVRGKGV